MAGIPDVTNELEEKNAANKIIDQEVVFNYEPIKLFIKRMCSTTNLTCFSILNS